MFTNIKQLATLPTPCYYYNLELLQQTIESLKKSADPRAYHVHYAMKANTDPRVLRLISSMGLGADCVSGNEVAHALQHGFKASGITFAGVGKTDDEIQLGLSEDIFCFNCESQQEIKVINTLAGKMGKVANIAIRINPNVDAHSHHYITTGLEENKFGICFWEFEAVAALLKQMKNIRLIALHFHIGSQITDMDVFRSLCLKVNEYNTWFSNQGFTIAHINVGGGLGVNYQEPDQEPIPDFESYFKTFEDFLQPLPNQQIHFELGRAIVAQCGALLSKALYIKKGANTNFVILDAGMTDLIRPALYQAYHKIENISQHNHPNQLDYDVVGPICESSDCFGKKVSLPETSRGDLLAIRTAGAYGEVMASQYNLRKLPFVAYSDQVN